MFIKQEVGRKLASIILDAEVCLYKQWFAGSKNTVADSLSRDCYYMSNETHEKFLNYVCPHQLPKHFQIKQIPKEISSFVISILERLPVKKLRLKAQSPSEIARGNVGTLSYLASELKTTSSLTDSQDLLKISQCQPSVKPLEKPPSIQAITKIWWKEQSTPPCHMWHRPFGQTTGETPDWTEMVKNASYSKNNSGGIGIKMEA